MQILSTKITIPRQRARLVVRPHLSRKLDQGLECGFTLISAPAGYGKTTLLSAWLHSSSMPAAWLSLDAGDNDLARFLAYLVSALQTIQPGVGKSVLAMLQSTRVLQAEALLSSLINETALDANGLILVLDDYHFIQDPSIHQVVSFLIEHLPTQIRIVICTRADPPFPLARWRVQSKMVELRAIDLKFSTSETETFLNQSMGLSISNKNAALLAARTEGWIAGLQMAALSLQVQDDTDSFIRTFAGSNRHIIDYLMEEVLGKQPEGVQTFLLQTSILARLSGGLCGAVTGRADSQSILEYLEKVNLFVVSLDDQRVWYRYHHLFSNLLIRRLESILPEIISGLHSRASEWLEKNGLYSEAITHAFSAGDFERAGQLIERTADSTLMHGALKTFLGWVDRLPEVVARKHPLLSVYHADALLLSGKPMVQVLRRLEGLPEYDAIQALVASYQGNVRLSQELSMRALSGLPEESLFLRGTLTSSLGAMYLLSGDVDQAIQCFQEVAEIGRAGGNLMLRVIALSRLGQLYLIQGEPHKAREATLSALDDAGGRQSNLMPVAGMPLMVLALIEREQDELESALAHIHQAADLTSISGGFWRVDCFVIEALILQSKGDINGALDAIRNARAISSQTEANRFDDIYTAAYEAQLLIVQGDLNTASQWAGEERFKIPLHSIPQQSDLPPNPDLYHLVEVEQITLAKLFLAKGQPEAALAVLETLLPESKRRSRTLSVIENLALQAVAHQSQGRTSKAVNLLESALEIASPAGYIRVFVDQGQVMRDLLLSAAKSRIAPDLVDRLLAAYNRRQPITLFSGISSALEEVLSEREIEVLHCLEKRASDKEIAAALVISRETVHKHLANLYSKLGVHSRKEAVARARELGLL